MSTSTHIPVSGLDRRFSNDGPLLARLVSEVAGEPKAILGPRVEELESWLAQTLGVAHVIAASSGTGALLITLRAAGIGPGSKVVVPAFGHVAPAAAVARLGAEVVFVDVRDDDLTLDPEAFARVAGEVQAVIPVHQFTALADMEAIGEIARRSKVFVLEDSAVALGARWPQRPAGTAGDVGIFSFHPVKVFGTVGDAGAAVTDDGELAETIRRLRNHGQGQARFHYDMLGFNSRMDEILAGHLLSRTSRLEDLVDRRVALIERYLRGLEGIPDLRLPSFAASHRLAYLMTVRTPRRDELAEALRAAGVETAVQYPVPIPHTQAFAEHPQATGSFPVSERAGREILTLPLFPELTDDEVDEVTRQVRRVFL